MSLYSDWMDLSQGVLQKAGVSSEGTHSWGVKRAPIYFRENVQGWDFPDLKQSYLNIVPYSDDAFKDEFLSDESCAVLFSNKNYNSSLKVKNIFFQPRLSMGDTEKRVLSQVDTNVDLGIDPYSVALWKGELCSMGQPLQNIDIDRPNLKVFRLSTLAYDLAGATPVQQLAVLLSSTHQLIKNYEGVYSPEKILSLISYEVSLNNHAFINIAKLQALRLLLLRFYEVLGVSNSGETSIYSTPSPRYMATREPWNNILRLTVMNFSSSAGGAQGFISLPFDSLARAQGQRVSRNNFMVLDQESFINKVNYPSSGSGLSEDLVTQLCHQGWTYFQEMEKKDGLLGVLQSGWLQKEIEIEHKKEKQSFLNRETKMIGVNEFALTQSLSHEFPLVSSEDKKDISQWWIDYVESENVKKLSDVQRLKPCQLSEDFEKWQFLSDSYRKDNGYGIKVSLYCENEKTMKAKVAMAEKLLALAGVEVDVINGESTAEMGKVGFFVAADPEGDLVLKSLDEFKKKGCAYTLWVGERKQSHFDDFIGNASSLMETFEQIFKVYGVSL